MVEADKTGSAMAAANSWPVSGDTHGAYCAEAFAVAVAANTNRLWVYPDDSNRITLDRWSALGSGRPYAVFVADLDGYRCTPLDFDVLKGDAAADANACAAMLRLVGIRHAEAVSGPSGGRHILITWQERIPARLVAQLARELRTRYRTLDIGGLTNPSTGCIRPPLAPHRLGGRSRPIGNAETALTALMVANPVGAFDDWLDLIGGDCPRVGRRIAVLIRDGDPAGRYKSNSEARIAATVAYRIAGATEQEWLQAMEGSPLTVRPDGRHCTNLAGEWRRAGEIALRLPTIRNRQDAQVRIGQVRAFVLGNHEEWRGKAGATDRQVILGHLSLASRIGKVEYDASVREIAELAGVSAKTVVTAQRRLVERGYLRHMKGPRPVGAANSWRLSFAPNFPHTDTPPVDIGVGKPSDDFDPWRWRGLGLSSLHVYQLLLAEPARKTAELAEALGVTPGAARKQLRKLAAHDLAIREEGRWRPRSANFQAVAQAVGTAGVGAKQKRLHRRQREGYRDLIAASVSATSNGDEAVGAQ